MNSSFLRRLPVQVLTLLVILLAATALTFIITNVLPGDAAVAILGDSATPADIASLRTELGLDRNVVVRYVDWLGHALHGDLGKSYRTREHISTMIGDRLPVTLELIVLTQLIALGFAVPMSMPRYTNALSTLMISVG